MAGLLVAALVAALVVSSPEMSTSIRTNICKIVGLAGISCGADSTQTRAPEDYVPPEKCVVASDADGFSGGISVTFVCVEGDELWKVEQLGDGTARLTRMRGAGAGATIGVGVDAAMTIDNNRFGVEATAGLSEVLGYQAGDVYYAADALFSDPHEKREPDEWNSEGVIGVDADARVADLWSSAEASILAEAHLGTRHRRDGSTTDSFRPNISAGISGSTVTADAEASIAAGDQ